MTFQDAVRTCFGKYATFQGRARRSEYWWFALFTWIATFVAGALDRMLFGPDYGVFGVIAGLALIVPIIAVGVRRLHDIDRTGWWLLISLIPLFGALVLIYWFVQPGTAGRNQYGAEPSDNPAGA